jgi:hypothetical protein
MPTYRIFVSTFPNFFGYTDKRGYGVLTAYKFSMYAWKEYQSDVQITNWDN